MHLLYRSNNFWKASWKSLCERVNGLRHSLFNLLNCLITTASELREQGLDFCQSTLVYWLFYSSHTSHHPSQTPCLPWISYSTQKLMLYPLQDGRKAVWSIPYVSVAFFPSLKQNFIAYPSSKVCSRPDCILKFTSCDYQALVGCIPIPTVAVHLNLES